MPLRDQTKHHLLNDDDYKEMLDDLSHALKQVCSDAAHLEKNPHMQNFCCPHFGPLPDDATKSDILERAKQERVCLDLRSGMIPSQPTKIDTVQSQLFIESVFGELCLNQRFNKLEKELCCRTDPQTHQSLGLAGDNQSVARACALPRE
jgi:hypothetical protein